MVFAGAGASGAGVGAVNVAAMSVAIVPIFLLLDGIKGWLRRAGGSVVAAVATVVGTAATGVGCAVVVGWGKTTGGVATAASTIVGSAATTTATPAPRAASLAGGLLELDHSGGGLIADGFAEHLDLRLQRIDGALLDRMDSLVAAYAAPKLLTALVNNAVEALSLAATIP